MSTTGGGVRLGISAPDRADDVRRLEQLGVDSLWVGGHVASPNPSPEPMVWLARLVEQTRTATVGTATLALPLYPPAVVAKQLADLDRAAGGRLVVGVGVGGEYESDFAAAEVPVAERGSRAEEAMGLLRRFWTAEPVTHAGRHHRYDSLRIHPAPSHPGGPPLVVTGRSDAAARRAATLGDGWMPYLVSPERWARTADGVRAHAARSGRDLAGFGWYAHVFVAVDDDPAAARRHALGFFGSTWSRDVEAFVDRVACTGDAAGVAERLAAYVAAGARHLVVVPVGPEPTATAERLLTEVRPALP